MRLFAAPAPQSWLRKNRWWITGVTAAAVGILMFYAARTYRDYAVNGRLRLVPRFGAMRPALTRCHVA